MQCFSDPMCRCCECQGIHCLIPHPGHSHQHPVSMADVLSQASMDMRRTEEMWRLIENLQDALYKVEWVRRAPDNQWACAFCGGVSIEHGGDDHREGCEWQRLIGVGPKDIEAAIVNMGGTS